MFRTCEPLRDPHAAHASMAPLAPPDSARHRSRRRFAVVLQPLLTEGWRNSKRGVPTRWSSAVGQHRGQVVGGRAGEVVRAEGGVTLDRDMNVSVAGTESLRGGQMSPRRDVNCCRFGYANYARTVTSTSLDRVSRGLSFRSVRFGGVSHSLNRAG